MKFPVILLLSILVGCSSSPSAPIGPARDTGDVTTDGGNSSDADSDSPARDTDSDSGVVPIDTASQDFPLERVCESAVLTHDFEDLDFDREHAPLVNVARIENAGAPNIAFQNSAALFTGIKGLEAPHETVWANPVGSIVVQVTINRKPNPTEVFTIVAKDRLEAHQGDLELRYDENSIFTFRLQGDTELDIDRQVSIAKAEVEPATFLIHLGWDENSIQLNVDGAQNSRTIVNTGGLVPNISPIAFGITNSRKDLVAGDYAAELDGKIHYFSLYDRKLTDAEIAALPMCADET